MEFNRFHIIRLPGCLAEIDNTTVADRHLQLAATPLRAAVIAAHQPDLATHERAHADEAAGRIGDFSHAGHRVEGAIYRTNEKPPEGGFFFATTTRFLGEIW